MNKTESLIGMYGTIILVHVSGNIYTGIIFMGLAIFYAYNYLKN